MLYLMVYWKIESELVFISYNQKFLLYLQKSSVLFIQSMMSTINQSKVLLLHVKTN